MKFFIKYNKTIIWSLVILLLCIMPASDIPKVKIAGIDKVVHFGLFGVLATLLVSETNRLRTLRDCDKKSIILGLIVPIIYGGLIELIQQQLPSRSAELFDLVADSAGTIVAVLIYPFVNRITRGFF
ncbi:MAG: VanZ family protein [Bacteroidales bacterium]|nr:VanZ family protein [Bacteroidales bacterium]